MSWVVAFTMGTGATDFHLLTHVADRQTQVDSRVLAHYQRDAGADPFGKAVLPGAHLILANGKCNQFVSPGLVRVVVRAMPVSRFFAVTVAPETTAPLWSVTRPDKLADTWATAGRATETQNRTDLYPQTTAPAKHPHSP